MSQMRSSSMRVCMKSVRCSKPRRTRRSNALTCRFFSASWNDVSDAGSCWWSPTMTTRSTVGSSADTTHGSGISPASSITSAVGWYLRTSSWKMLQPVIVQKTIFLFLIARYWRS